MGTNVSPSGGTSRVKAVSELKEMSYFQARLDDLRHYRSCQLMLFVFVSVVVGGVYYLFIYSGGEYNPQAVGGAQCEFSDSADTRMINGDLLLRKTGNEGIEEWDIYLDAGKYDIAYRYRPWSTASGDLVISFRNPDDGSYNLDIIHHQEGVRWQAGKKTFTIKNDDDYRMKVLVAQGMPWCLEVVPHSES